MGMLPFRIHVGDRALDDLARRIDATRWPDVGWTTGWSTGTDDRTLRMLVRYWRREFDWSAQQAALNRLAHLRGRIDGEEMHCVLSPGPGSAHRLPVLLLHGWPSSFVEYLDAAPLLAAGSDDAPGLDVVVPSLPGFGFSEPARAPGMHPDRIAERLHLLMQTLGYRRYGVQGGDWGAIIGTALARRHPEAVVGLHLTFPPTAELVPRADDPVEHTAEVVDYRQRRAAFEREETGYSRLQSTRPQTLGYAMNDSPVGLLAWMLEKFWAWSDHRDDVWSRIDRDRLLTNVMIYWLTGTALSASRIYHERSHPTEPLATGPVTVPTAYARFPAEPWAAPAVLLERAYHLVRVTEHHAGGHFPALETPEAFAGDVASFFATLRA